MSISIGQHKFDGPVSNLAEIPSAPGLYALLHKENRYLSLVEIDQSNNLARTLQFSLPCKQDQMVVLMRCDSGDRRREILHELLRVYEFEDEEPVQAAVARRTETKQGVSMALQ